MAERRIPSSRPAIQPASLKASHCRIALAVATCFTAGVLTAHAAGGNLPTGATYDPTKVASITTNGNIMTIKTLANRTVFGWDNHDIGAGYGVNYIQPTASSWVLSKVNSPDPTTIYGSLTSNGGIWLINKSGILVGNGARIDVAGFIGSTLNVTDANFLAGKLKFDATPGAGNVTVEQGAKITTPSGGSVYLVAPNVSNAGIITTPKGETILAAGETVELIDTGTPGVKVEITGAVGNATNLGEIYAEAGRIGIAGVLVKNSGTLNASSVVSEGGRVFLKASQDAYVDGNGRIVTTGTKGGKVEVLGNRVAIADNASIDASGTSGGGQVLVGGDYQGKNPGVQNASATYFGKNASIKADALIKGDGGKVIVWSDDTTRAYGSISAKGGAQGGNGGFIETSGGWLDTAGIRVTAAAPHGKSGAWLLDPYDLEVISGTDAHGTDAGTPGEVTYFGYANGASVIDHSTIEGQLNSGTNVILDTHLPNSSSVVGTDFGDITVNAAIAKTAGGDATLWLKADRNIVINQDISSTSGKLNLTLQARAYDAPTGNVQVYANITTNGGNVWIGGGSAINGVTGEVLGNAIGYAGDDGYGGSVPYSQRYGFLIENGKTINASGSGGGGNISIRGQGYSFPGASSADTDGVEINNGHLITNGTGSIKLFGQAGDGATGATSGVYILGSIETDLGDITIEGHGGNLSGSANRGVKLDGASIVSYGGTISIAGYGGNSNGAGGNGNYGILINGSGNNISNFGGNITLSGFGGNDTQGGAQDNGGIYADAGNSIGTWGSGDITLYGDGRGTSGSGASQWGDGIYIDASTISTNGGAGHITIEGHSSLGTNSSGVYLYGTNVNAGDGGIEITGTGWGSDYSHGVVLDDASTVTTTGLGNISITGTAVGTNSHGVYLWSDVGNPIVQAYGSGSITLSGNTSGTAEGLYISAGDSVLANTGDLILEAGSAGTDSITLAGSTIDGYGVLYLKPVLGNTSMGFGDGSTGDFNISNADHDAFNTNDHFTQLVIGRSGGTHVIDIMHDVQPANVVFNASSVTLESGYTMALTNGGSVAVYGGYFYNDGTVDLNHGTLYTDNGFSNNSSGLLKGPGTIGGNLDNYGTVWINGGGSGTLSVTGNFTQYGGGTLKVDVAGNGQSDLLQVGGTANLDGTLYLNAGYGGYLSSASPGDAITVLSAGTINGDFASISNQGVFTGVNITGTYALSVPGGGGCGDGFEACWIGGDGLWSDAGNWLNGYIPVNSTDDVRLDGTGYTITLAGQSVTIGRFYSAHDHFVFNGGGTYSLTTNDTVNFGAGTSFTVNSGTANFNAQTTLSQFNLNGGVAAFNALTSISQVYLWNGTANFNGASTVSGFYFYGGSTLGGTGALTVTDDFGQYGGTINRTGSLDITQTSGDLYYNGGTTGSLGLHAPGSNIYIDSGNVTVNGTFTATASGDLDISNVSVHAYDASINVGGTFGVHGYYGSASLTTDGPIDIHAGNLELVAAAYGGQSAYISSGYGGVSIHAGNVLLQSSSNGSAYIDANYGNVDITATGSVTLDSSMGQNAHLWAYGGNVLISAGSLSLISGSGYAYIESRQDPFSGIGGHVVIATSGDVTLNSIYGGSVDIGGYGGGVTIGAGGALSLWGNNSSVYAYQSDINISAGSVNLIGNGGYGSNFIGTDSGDIHIHTTGNVSLAYGGYVQAHYGLVDIVAGGSVLLDNNSYIYTYGDWYGSNAISILAGRDVSLDHYSSIWAENASAPPDVGISARGNISLDNGSYIGAGNDVNLLLTGADSELRLNSTEGSYSYIVSDYQMQRLATTKITFLNRTSGGIVIDGTPTDLATEGASFYGGSGIFAGTGYVPVWDKNGVELLYLGDNEAAKTVNNVLNDFFDKLSDATDIQGDAEAKKKKLESDQQGKDQNGQENKSTNHCS